MDIQKICQKCQGTGEIIPYGGSPQNCDRCAGTGRNDEGEISNGTKTLEERLTDLEDKIDDIINKCTDIKEVVDAL